MKIIKADVMLDGSRHPVLVQEEAFEYSGAAVLESSETTAEVMNRVFHMEDLAEEHVYLAALDIQNCPSGFFLLSRGTVDASAVGIREIMIRLLLCGASRFILVHNHPAGSTSPSGQDIRITEKVAKATEIMGLEFLDHIIIGKGGFYSLRDIITGK